MMRWWEERVMKRGSQCHAWVKVKISCWNTTLTSDKVNNINKTFLKALYHTAHCPLSGESPFEKLGPLVKTCLDNRNVWKVHEKKVQHICFQHVFWISKWQNRKILLKCHLKKPKQDYAPTPPMKNKAMFPYRWSSSTSKLDNAWMYSDILHYCCSVCQHDLRVHSVSGVLTLMWMLSIQMCPLVPCAKKPSITTYQSKTWGEGRRQRGMRKIGDNSEEEKTIKSLYGAFDFNAAFPPLQASLADFFMRTLTTCDVPDVYSDAFRDSDLLLLVTKSNLARGDRGVKKMMLSYALRWMFL